MRYIAILILIGFGTTILRGQSYDGLWISSYTQENDAVKRITYYDNEKGKVKTKRNPVDYDTIYNGNFGLIHFQSEQRLVYIQNGMKQNLGYKVKNGEIRFHTNYLRYKGRIEDEKLILSVKTLTMPADYKEIFMKAEASRLVLKESPEKIFFRNSYWKIKSIDEELDFQMNLYFRDSSSVLYILETDNYKFSDKAWVTTGNYENNLYLYIWDGFHSNLFVFNSRDEESIIGYTTIFNPLNFPRPDNCKIKMYVETLPDSILIEKIKNNIVGKWKSIEYCDQQDTSWIGMGYPFTPFHFEFNADNSFSIYDDSSLNKSDSTWQKLDGSWELDQTGRCIKLNVPNEYPHYILIDEINENLIRINHRISFILNCDNWNNTLLLKKWP